MNWHRLVCAFGSHWWARLGRNWRGCAVCNQQQRYISDIAGMHGFWLDLRPTGQVGANVEPEDLEADA